MINIIIGLGVSLICLSIIGVYIYKKVKGLPTGECATCADKGKGLVKQYNKTYSKKIK